MQMARCKNKTDAQYRAILGVLKEFIRISLIDDNGVREGATPLVPIRDKTGRKVGGIETLSNS